MPDEMNTYLGEMPPALEISKGEGFENPLEKIEKLLTCSICLDRYKHPKLLPCNHTFCLECLERYADTVLRHLKCPECRAEYPIPLEGVKSFPTNLTLIAFLEIHLEANEENSRQLEVYIKGYNRQRCKVCDEKAEVEICYHCEKKACLECRTSHMEMLKRDLSRLLGQVRRLSNRVKGASEGMSKGTEQLTSNGMSAKREITEYFERYRNELRRREEHLLAEVDTFVEIERRLMRTLDDTLRVESVNLEDACNWLDDILNSKKSATDEELGRIKRVFVDGLEYLRNFQPDSDGLVAKKLRFSPGDDAAKLSITINNFGELTVSLPQFTNRYLPLEQHYLPKPFKMGLESDFYRTSKITELTDGISVGRRKTTRAATDEEGIALYRRLRQNLEQSGSGSSAYGRSGSPPPGITLNPNQLSPWSRTFAPSAPTSQSVTPRTITPTPSDSSEPLTRSKSPLVVSTEEQPKSVIEGVKKDAPQKSDKPIEETSNEKNKESHPVKHRSTVQAKPIAKSPLPNTKLCAAGKKELKKVESTQNETTTKKETPTASSSNKVPQHYQPATMPPSFTSFVSGNQTKRPLKQHSPVPKSKANEPVNEKNSQQVPKNEMGEGWPKSNQQNLNNSHSTINQAAKSSTKEDPCQKTTPVSPCLEKPSQNRAKESQTFRDNNQKTKQEPEVQPAKPSTSERVNSHSNLNANKVTNGKETTKKKVQNEEEEEEEESEPIQATSNASIIHSSSKKFRVFCWRPSAEDETTGIGGAKSFDSSTLTGSVHHPIPVTHYSSPTPVASDEGEKSARSENKAKSSGEWALRRQKRLFGVRSKTNPNISAGSQSSQASTSLEDDSHQTNHLNGQATSNERRRNLKLPPTPDNGPGDISGSAEKNSEHNTYRGRRSSLVPDREIELNPVDDTTFASRSRSKDRRDESKFSSRRASPNNHWAYAALARIPPAIDYTTKEIPKKVIGRRGNGPAEFQWPRGIAVLPGNEFAIADSCNNRVQLFNSNCHVIGNVGKYGLENGQFDGCVSVCYSKYRHNLIVSDRHRIQIFDSEGLFIRKFGSKGKGNGQFNNAWGVAVNELGLIYVVDKDNHRVQVFDHNGTFISKFGSFGDGPRQFNHPLYIAVHNPTSNIFVSDSANNRICVFDCDGIPIYNIGHDGPPFFQVKMPRGLAVDNQGYCVVADAGNNRVMVFSPEGNPVHMFGSWGLLNGQFKGIEGVALFGAQIIVTDRENHRVQIF